MKRLFILFIIAFALSSCLSRIVINDGVYRNSIYYSSIEEVDNTVSGVRGTVSVTANTYETPDETYEDRLRKFDRFTYTVSVLPLTWDFYWNYDYSWKWRYSWDYGWRYGWRYGYYGYYTPWRNGRYWYYSFYRPYHHPHNYFHYPVKPLRDHRNVYYTRRGGGYSATRVNHLPERRNNAGRNSTGVLKNRPAVNKSAVQTRRPSTSRTATQSRQQSRTVYNQTQRTGYSRGATNRSSNTGRDYYKNSSPARSSQPNTRYNERSTSHQSSGASHSSGNGGGSTTRRK